MLETHAIVEDLILEELRKRNYLSISEKEYLLICNEIKLHHKIAFEEFSEGIQSLVNKKLLIPNVSDSGIRFYQFSDELKTMLDIK